MDLKWQSIIEHLLKKANKKALDHQKTNTFWCPGVWPTRGVHREDQEFHRVSKIRYN